MTRCGGENQKELRICVSRPLKLLAEDAINFTIAWGLEIFKAWLLLPLG